MCLLSFDKHTLSTLMRSMKDDSEPLQVQVQKAVDEYLRSIEPNHLDKFLNEYTPLGQDQIRVLRHNNQH